jgi:hypothetical protein
VSNVQARTKRGYAQDAIVNGFLELIDEAANGPVPSAKNPVVVRTP